MKSLFDDIQSMTSCLCSDTCARVFYLLLLLELFELLEHKVHLLGGGQRGDVPVEVLAVVLGVIVGLAAGVDPQTGIPHPAPALTALLGWRREPAATDHKVPLQKNPL